MTRFTLTATVAALTFLSTPAFAQDAPKDVVKDKAVETVMDTATDTATDMAKDKMSVKGDPLMIKTDDTDMRVTNGEMTVDPTVGVIITGDEIVTQPTPMPEGEMIEKAKTPWMSPEMTAEPAAPAPTDIPAAQGEVTQVTIACPEGTTAQPDGTCMMDAE